MSACALLFIQQAMAAGMDCAKASNTVEKTICANKGLYDLDAQMGMLYRQLMTTSAQAQPDLKQTQRSWLKTRNECADEVTCLDSALSRAPATFANAVDSSPPPINRMVLINRSWMTSKTVFGPRAKLIRNLPWNGHSPHCH